jgi:hypothetical protein
MHVTRNLGWRPTSVSGGGRGGYRISPIWDKGGGERVADFTIKAQSVLFYDVLRCPKWPMVWGQFITKNDREISCAGHCDIPIRGRKQWLFSLQCKFIKPYYYKNPSVFKIIQLFNSENLKVMYNLGKYLSLATKLRNYVSC